MGTTLIVNPGSTSTKLALVLRDNKLVRFTFEDTGKGFDWCIEENQEKGLCESVTASQFQQPVSHTINYLLQQGKLKSVTDIDTVAVRIVSPGVAFTKHQVIDKAYIESLNKTERFAPLHIPPVLRVIENVKKLLPQAKLLAISDSAFHQTIPEYSRTYSVKNNDSEELGIKRYGYHGLSVSSIASRLETIFGYVPERTIVAHIGGGMSVTALHHGVSRLTSMGFAPASGLMMGERAGDLDASAMLALIEGKKLSGLKAHQYLNQAGGFRALLGVSDLRLVLKLYQEGDSKAILAINMWVEQFTKIVGSYFAVLGGLDAMVLTATAMTRNPELRKILLSQLGSLGVAIDEVKNESVINRDGLIELEGSRVKIAVVKTDEILEMLSAVNDFNKT
jgi:acetate kinase